MKLDPRDIIIRPVLTEKAMNLSGARKYVFEVAPKATKPQIKRAVEELFGVKVKKVNTMWMKPKPRRYFWRGRPGRTKRWKKAIVTLAEGESLDILEV